MTKHFFLSPDLQLLPRWQEAFPEAVAVAAVPVDLIHDDSSILWVSTRVPGWREQLVQQRGDAGIRSVVISGTPGQIEGLQALEAGARGYCHAYATPAMLREVAVVVLHGGLWVGPELMARAIRATSAGGVPTDLSSVDALASLTEREREVALAVARGLTNKEVAAALDITERTVKAHLSAIFEKLAVRDRMQLALKMSSHAGALAP
ncbi:MAG: DNA-binding response regulator [Betaproteobacteria bacterium HGW-Betaproteobacteria-13]|jgi:DNA-binding NarL/FixJ family response regulator|nr:MAG: DNA-binding response regulator [Betaproteobacteria bacterium HGW-Betaproteobacteria-13]